MSAANTHHHVWRLLMEHGVATFGTNPVLVREPKSDAFEVRQCNEVHTLDQLLEQKEATRPA